MMNDINYKAVDTRKIVDYLESCPGNIPVFRCRQAAGISCSIRIGTERVY